MQGGEPAISTAEIAALVAPLLALIVVFAIDSVDEGDSLRYRGIIAFFGLGALGPILLVLVSGVIAPEPDNQGIIRIFTLIALLFIEILIVAVVMKETHVGIEKQFSGSRDKFLFYGITFGGLLAWYVLLLILF